MASISEPLLGAGAEAKNDWAQASAATSVTFTGEGQIRRGIEVQIGINALATADAGLSKFVDATVRGDAFAEARASLRLQLPLNLFDEFGLTVAAQAVAQAAAGIEVGLGLRVGDFLALLRRNAESEGLPIDLVLLLLDEATVGGKFEVHIAAAAMAYASVLITGKVVKEPGFQVFVDAGLGLAAGVGFSGSLDLGIHDFRKFYGRAVDRTISSVVEGIASQLPADDRQLMPVVRALGPVASTALRLAYEIGDDIAENHPGNDPEGAADLANHCVGVILEEAQRFLFGRFLEAGLRSIERLVTHDVPAMASGFWDSLMPERQALASVLYRMPAEPFQPTDENAEYWAELVTRTTLLIARLPIGGPEMTRGLAIVFAATELLTEAIRSRINTAESYAFAIGAGRVASPPPPFGGPIADDPGDRIRQDINTVLRSSGLPRSSLSQDLDYADLIAYLVSDVAIAALRDAIPDVDQYLAIFQDPAIAGDLEAVLRVLLTNRDAFAENQAGDRDPQATLRALLGVLDAFITTKLNEDFVPELNQRLTDNNVKLYFNEVIMSTLLFIKDVAFQTVLDWEEHPPDQAAFTEALAGVMTMLLGRSLVLVGDGFMAAMQADMQRACTQAAATVDSAHDPFTALGIQASPELKALLADTLCIGGEVFGPLPPNTRQRLRFVLYDVMETLPPTKAAQASFMTNLADQAFFPNQQSVDELAQQLLAISRDRFQLFVERVLEAGGTFVLNAIEDFIQNVITTVTAWAKDLETAIRGLADDVQKLDQTIRQLTADAQQAFSEATATLETLLDEFSNQNLRNRLRQEVADSVFQEAKSTLSANPVFRALPRDIRQFVRNVLKGLIDGMIEGPVLDPMFAAIGGLAGELESMLDDVRELNPEQPLAPQILDLVMDHMEDRIKNSFGGSSPRIDVGFSVTIFGFSQHFSLGTVNLPFNTIFALLRGAINNLSFYENALQQASAALAKAFSKSLSLDAKQNDRDGKQSDHDRLNRIESEFNATPKTVTVLNPVQNLVYDDDVAVSFSLGGVPASYLGLEKDEQQRVLIFLNGNLIPPQALAHDQPFATLDAGELLKPVNVNRQVRFDPSRNALIGKSAQIGFFQQVESGAAESPNSGNSLPLQGAIRSLAAGRSKGSAHPAPQQSVKQSGAASTVTSTLANVLPGRRMTATKRTNLERSLPQGTTIQFLADRGHLVVGTNTLVVVVIDPGGQRYQQVVSFGVAAAAPAPEAAPGTGSRLPIVPGRKKGGRPIRVPGGIALHYDREAIARQITKSANFMAKQSALHFKGLGKQK